LKLQPLKPPLGEEACLYQAATELSFLPSCLATGSKIPSQKHLLTVSGRGSGWCNDRRKLTKQTVVYVVQKRKIKQKGKVNKKKVS
jgi:hypothetical protein